MAEDDDDFAPIGEAMRVGASRSPVSRYLAKHRASIAAIIAQVGRVNWTAVAEAGTARGIYGLDGKPVSPDGWRVAWARVSRGHPLPAKPEPPPARRDVVFLTDKAQPAGGAAVEAATGDDPMDAFRRRIAARSGIIPGDD